MNILHGNQSTEIRSLSGFEGHVYRDSVMDVQRQEVKGQLFDFILLTIVPTSRLFQLAAVSFAPSSFTGRGK